MTKTLDLYEYPNNAAAQAAYPTSGGPTYSSDLCTDGTASASSIFSAGYEAAKAFDNTDAEWVTSDTPTPHWLTYDFGEGNSETINKYVIKGASTSAQSPTDFKFQGSNNNVDWDDLDIQSDLSWDFYEIKTFTSFSEGTNTTAYRYYRILYVSTPAYGALTEVEMMEITGLELQCYSEDTIKEQGTYSLKVIAVQTGSLNDTLTRTVAPTIDLSGIDTLELYVYASRTGTNIEVSIHDSGGTTTSKSIAITSANAWEKTTWDISAVADANKDDIDNIIIKVTNADALNTFYVDNFYGVEIAVYPIARLNKNRISGYHCFMDAYMRAKRTGFTPLKLPDGTVF